MITAAGGLADEGTIYRIAADGAFETIHDFVHSEGLGPLSRLLEMAPGKSIGTLSLGTLSHGSNGGAVYRFNFTPGNIAPVAVDGSGTTPEDTPLTGQFSASDGNSDPLTFSITTNGSYGTAVITDPATGTFSYTLLANLFGTDIVRFKANDGHMDAIAATFTITIEPVNDALVVSDWGVSTSENTPVTSTVFANDIDSASFTYAIVANGTKGTAEMLDAAAGLFRYTPNAGTFGNDSFAFQSSDGSLSSNVATVSVSIAAVNDPPQAVTGVVTTTEGVALSGTLQASDPEGNPVTFAVTGVATLGTVLVTDASTGAFTYTPNPGATGYVLVLN